MENCCCFLLPFFISSKNCRELRDHVSTIPNVGGGRRSYDGTGFVVVCGGLVVASSLRAAPPGVTAIFQRGSHSSRRDSGTDDSKLGMASEMLRHASGFTYGDAGLECGYVDSWSLCPTGEASGLYGTPLRETRVTRGSRHIPGIGMYFWRARISYDAFWTPYHLGAIGSGRWSECIAPSPRAYLSASCGTQVSIRGCASWVLRRGRGCVKEDASDMRPRGRCNVDDGLQRCGEGVFAPLVRYR